MHNSHRQPVNITSLPYIPRSIFVFLSSFSLFDFFGTELAASVHRNPMDLTSTFVLEFHQRSVFVGTGFAFAGNPISNVLLVITLTTEFDLMHNAHVIALQGIEMQCMTHTTRLYFNLNAIACVTHS